jgi:hypothetical protein
LANFDDIEKTNFKNWDDSSKVELEENSKEIGSYYLQQAYLDSFFLEGILNTIIVDMDNYKSLGKAIDIKNIINQK